MLESTPENLNQKISVPDVLREEAESGLAGAILGSIFVILMLLVLHYFNILNLSQIIPSLSFLPRSGQQNSFVSPSVSPPPIESCRVRSNDYSLVYDVTDTRGIITGQYRGTIQSITPNASMAAVTIVSGDGKATHTFRIDASTPFYDAVHAKKLKLLDFAPGQYVGISFNCNKSNGNQFTIVDMGIQEK